MASYEYGPLGPFRGKIGPVIGSSWKGKPYIKSRPSKIRKKATEKKKSAQSALSFMSKWLAPINELVMIGFQYYDLSKTGRMAAHSYNAVNALVKLPEGFSIDYNKALFSYGDLPGVRSAKATLTEENTIVITWNTETIEGTRASDVLMYMVYFPDNKCNVNYGIGQYCRKDGEMRLRMPEEYMDGRMEIMIAFKSLIDNSVSTSQYLGSFSINQTINLPEQVQVCLPVPVEHILVLKR